MRQEYTLVGAGTLFSRTLLASYCVLIVPLGSHAHQNVWRAIGMLKTCNIVFIPLYQGVLGFLVGFNFSYIKALQ